MICPLDKYSQNSSANTSGEKCPISPEGVDAAWFWVMLHFQKGVNPPLPVPCESTFHWKQQNSNTVWSICLKLHFDYHSFKNALLMTIYFIKQLNIILCSNCHPLNLQDSDWKNKATKYKKPLWVDFLVPQCPNG